MLVKINVILDRVIECFSYMARVFLVFTFLFVVIEVFMRYFLNSSQPWTVDGTEYSMSFLTFLAAAWVLKKEGHVSMDVVVIRFNPRNQATIHAITSIIAALMCLLIIVFGVTGTWDHIQRGTTMIEKALEFPTASLIFIVPIGFVLLFIQFLRRSADYWKARGATLKEAKSRVERIAKDDS